MPCVFGLRTEGLRAWGMICLDCRSFAILDMGRMAGRSGERRERATLDRLVDNNLAKIGVLHS